MGIIIYASHRGMKILPDVERRAIFSSKDFLYLSGLCTCVHYICLDCIHVCVVLHLFGLCNYMCSRSYICLDCVNQLSYPFSLLRLYTWVRAVLHTVQQFFSNCCFNLQREQNIIKECLIHNTLQIYVTVWYFPINVCVFLHTSIKIRRNFSISFRCFKTYSVSIFSSWCKVTKIFEKWWCI